MRAEEGAVLTGVGLAGGAAILSGEEPVPVAPTSGPLELLAILQLGVVEPSGDHGPRTAARVRR